MARWAWCAELVTDDYGHDTPCRQIAEVTNVRVDDDAVTVCTVQCPLHRVPKARLEDVCEMPD